MSTGDLNRIKSTSFFQRIPPPSEVQKQAQEEEEEEAARQEVREQEAAAFAASELEFAVVPVSESESDEDDEDDIFDTSYIDAIAAGEVKLAYIPGWCNNYEKLFFFQWK